MDPWMVWFSVGVLCFVLALLGFVVWLFSIETRMHDAVELLTDIKRDLLRRDLTVRNRVGDLEVQIATLRECVETKVDAESEDAVEDLLEVVQELQG